MAAEVIMYKTPYCGFCVRASVLLKQKGIAFTEVDLSSDRDLRLRIMQASGRRTVPQIFINGQPIGGFQELATLERTGELDALLAAASASDAPTPAQG